MPDAAHNAYAASVRLSEEVRNVRCGATQDQGRANRVFARRTADEERGSAGWRACPAVLPEPRSLERDLSLGGAGSWPGPGVRGRHTRRLERQHMLRRRFRVRVRAATAGSPRVGCRTCVTANLAVLRFDRLAPIAMGASHHHERTAFSRNSA